MEPDASSCSYHVDPADRAHSLDDIILLADLAIWLADLIEDLGLLLGSFSFSGASHLEPNFGVNNPKP